MPLTNQQLIVSAVKLKITLLKAEVRMIKNLQHKFCMFLTVYIRLKHCIGLFKTAILCQSTI